MNFQELIIKKMIYLDYERGALMAHEAIIELLEKVNDGKFDQFTGEPLSDECEAEIKTIRNLIRLIKESKDYE